MMIKALCEILYDLESHGTDRWQSMPLYPNIVSLAAFHSGIWEVLDLLEINLCEY